MRGRFVALLLLALANPGALKAQVVRGTVLDAATLKPIPGASIRISPDSGDERRATSDSTGGFRMSLPRAGLFMVVVTRVGYARHDGDTVRVGESETVTLRVELDQRAVPLHPVVITDRRSGLPPGFEQRRALGFGRFLDRADIDKRHPLRTTDLFRGMPGVHLTPPARGVGLLLQLRKPTGYCEPAIWIDGLPLGENRGSLDFMIEANILEAVEVYPTVSTAPMQYRSGDCGIVLFWTRQVPEEAPPKPRRWKIALAASALVGLLLVVALSATS